MSELSDLYEQELLRDPENAERMRSRFFLNKTVAIIQVYEFGTNLVGRDHLELGISLIRWYLDGVDIAEGERLIATDKTAQDAAG